MSTFDGLLGTVLSMEYFPHEKGKLPMPFLK